MAIRDLASERLFVESGLSAGQTVELTEAQARPYLCDGASAAPTGGEYIGAVFQFRTPGGGLFGLLWTREEGKWKLVSYQPLNP